MTSDLSTAAPDLPPLFEAEGLPPKQDPFATAIDRAKTGASAGTFFWARRPDCVSLAVVLEPDRSLAESLPVCFVSLAAFMEALGSVIPPSVAVTFGWPDRIDVNGGLAGGIRIAHAPCRTPEEVPDWMVVSIIFAITGDTEDDSPGLKPEATTLYNEGGGSFDIVDFLERFCRHLMQWINDWQEDGFRSTEQAWRLRESGFGETTRIHLGGRRISGKLLRLDDLGGAVLKTGKGEKTYSLADGLRQASWSPDDLLLQR